MRRGVGCAITEPGSERCGYCGLQTTVSVLFDVGAHSRLDTFVPHERGHRTLKTYAECLCALTQGKEVIDSVGALSLWGIRVSVLIHSGSIL